MKLEPKILEGRFVRLEPLEERHREGLRAPAGEEDIWRFIPERGFGPFYDAMFTKRLDRTRSGEWIAHAVRRRADDALVGQTCFLNIDAHNDRVEIGATWYGADARGGPVNPECKYLLMEAAFEAGALRVELKTDMRNARSRAAIAKLGAKEEGVLRRHTKMWDGHVRDTVYFSVLDREWPAVRAGLEARLARFG
ncbi:MAG TPA: GNAT family protein [Caulobacterales bacterium]|jgi:RimJ/RimL family protein N-acetyltransferase|nr:GNAT family protein [Caulobacterales bacterium]